MTEIIEQIFNDNHMINFQEITKICPLINKQGTTTQHNFEQECLTNINWLNYLISFSDNLTTSLRKFPNTNQNIRSNKETNQRTGEHKTIITNNSSIKSQPRKLKVMIGLM